MSIVSESSGVTGELNQDLQGGLELISNDQQIVFTKYTKSVIPTDGFVFWVASSTITVQGSLHILTDKHQEEDQTLAINRMLFTTSQQVTEFNAISPTDLWVGTWDTSTGTIQVAFSGHSAYYLNAGLWHYFGDAVYPALASQLVASPADLPTGPIVSNSLPIWLGLTQYGSVYPSYLVPDNVQPPYITAHIEPEGTIALQGFANYIWPGNPSPLTALQPMASSQLMKDKVRLTLYGFNNQQAIQYLSYLIDYSRNTDDFGFMNFPAIQDDKRGQVEISAIAMKKTIEIDASYYQGTADAVARRLILSAAVSTTIN